MLHHSSSLASVFHPPELAGEGAPLRSELAGEEDLFSGNLAESIDHLTEIFLHRSRLLQGQARERQASLNRQRAQSFFVVEMEFPHRDALWDLPQAVPKKDLVISRQRNAFVAHVAFEQLSNDRIQRSVRLQAVASASRSSGMESV